MKEIHREGDTNIKRQRQRRERDEGRDRDRKTEKEKLPVHFTHLINGRMFSQISLLLHIFYTF